MKPPTIVHTKRPKPRPVRKPKSEPVSKIVFSPSARTLAAIARWERLTGRSK